MTDDDHRHRSPLDHAMDLLVYAPLGFVAEAPSLLPRFAKRGRDEVHARLRALGVVGPDDPTPTDGPERPHLESVRTVRPEPTNGVRPNTTGIDPESLAINEYESLSASQVVPRLDGLTPDELEAVRRYENGNRARRTILGRIAQLQGS